jgi:hypothetical protein
MNEKSSISLAAKRGTPGSPASAHTGHVTTADAPATGPDIQRQRSKPNGAMRRRTRFLFIATAAVLGAFLLTGCGSAGSGTNVAQHLLQLFPWLGSLGLAFIQGLLAQYGSNIPALLVAAAAALGM